MSDAPVRALVRSRLAPWDVVIHLSIPTLLIAVYVSPIAAESLLFRPGASGVTDAYVSLLAHTTYPHLLGNVFGFLVLSLLSLLLLGGVSRRRSYYRAFLGILVAVPPLAAALLGRYLAWAAPERVGYYRGGGFSLVTAAFLGVLGVAVATHQSERLSAPVSSSVASSSLLALALAVPSYRYANRPLIAGVLAVIGLVYLGSSARLLWTELDERSPVDVSLYVTGTLTFLGATNDLFPPDPENLGVTAHFVGLVLGFGVTWLAVIVEKEAGRRDGGEDGEGTIE